MEPKDTVEDPDEDNEAVEDKLEDRTKDYSNLKYIQEQIDDTYSQIEKAFEDKAEQNDTIDECWDLYHCNFNDNQSYNPMGNGVYVPIVRDALIARETRFINMLFPGTNRYSDIISNDGRVPHELIALLDYYVRRSQLRQMVMPALIRSGDISGNYALYLEWAAVERCITSKTKHPEAVTEADTPVEGAGEYDDVDYEEDKDEFPAVSVIDPRNLVVLPTTSRSVEEAEIVDVVLPFTKAKIKKWVKLGIFESSAANKLLLNMKTAAETKIPSTRKKFAMEAGIHVTSKGNTVAMIHQIWRKMKIKGEHRMMVTHMAGMNFILGCKRNPYWCDRIPVILQPLEPNPDSIWGPSQVKPVAQIQYQANDYANMALDSGMYGMLPIVMTDPEKNPRAGSMVLAMASVWLTDPNSTKFAEFPQLWKEGLAIVAECKQQIFQSLGVNPAMIPQGNAGKKPTQAQIAQEQQVIMETTSDNVALLQDGVLSKILEWFYELDYQYRTKAITVKKFGHLGLKAEMQQVEPFQERERFEFRWYGTEGFKAAQQVQQMISMLNVMTKLPPQALQGRKLDLGPVLEYISEATFGPRLAPHVLIDQRDQMSMDAGLENQLMHNLFPVQVHEMDNDVQHIQSHLMEFGQGVLQQHPMDDKVSELARGHILMHMQQMKVKAAAAMQQQVLAQGGAPRPGAVNQPPSGMQNPPGAIHKDQMPMSMPRPRVQ